MEVNVHHAKTHLSKILQQVEAGEEITIARDGVPVARLVPMARPTQHRQLGMYRDQVWMRLCLTQERQAACFIRI
jgi:prevent-host-death family protein